jgi:predicted deacylase
VIWPRGCPKPCPRKAELFPIEQIKNDPGQSGTLETAFIEAGIPAITVEVGGPRSSMRERSQ